MKRNLTLATTALMLIFAVACGSMNRATPAEWDKTSMEADVRSKVAGAVPGKTFDIGVSINDDRVVTLNGTVGSQADKNAIGSAAESVNGVRGVINNIAIR